MIPYFPSIDAPNVLQQLTSKKPSALDLKRHKSICAVIKATIPEPYIPPPVEQKSWRTLKVGDRLRLREGVSVEGWVPGVVYKVLRTTNKGCTLQREGLLTLGTLWSDPDWRVTWEKVKKR